MIAFHVNTVIYSFQFICFYVSTTYQHWRIPTSLEPCGRGCFLGPGTLSLAQGEAVFFQELFLHFVEFVCSAQDDSLIFPNQVENFSIFFILGNIIGMIYLRSCTLSRIIIGSYIYLISCAPFKHSDWLIYLSAMLYPFQALLLA